MTGIVEKARVGARGTDSVQIVDAARAAALRAAGIDFVLQYLGSVTAEGVQAILDAGLAFMPVTYAAHYDGPAAVAQLLACHIPQGTTVWLDLEGQASYATPPQVLIAKINAWADAVIAAGYEPGLYIGSPQPLTGDELYALRVVRYWKAPSRIVDRNGRSWDGPSCGFCMYQLWPSVTWAGVWADVDFIQQDFHSRVPSWVARASTITIGATSS